MVFRLMDVYCVGAGERVREVSCSAEKKFKVAKIRHAADKMTRIGASGPLHGPGQSPTFYQTTIEELLLHVSIRCYGGSIYRADSELFTPENGCYKTKQLRFRGTDLPTLDIGFVGKLTN